MPAAVDVNTTRVRSPDPVTLFTFTLLFDTTSTSICECGTVAGNEDAGAANLSWYFGFTRLLYCATSFSAPLTQLSGSARSVNCAGRSFGENLNVTARSLVSRVMLAAETPAFSEADFIGAEVSANELAVVKSDARSSVTG